MRRQAGFTLLEMLVALVVLGLVVAGLTQGLRFGLGATERQERLALQQGDLDALDRLLRRLVAQMDAGTARDPGRLAGTQAAAAFTTDLGAGASAIATNRADVRLNAEGRRLMLRWRPAVHAAPLVPAAPPGEVVLLDGIERLELSYWGPDGDAPPSWHGAWQQRALPALLRIRLVFPPGDARHWPDIVAGPAMPRPAS